MTLGHNIALGNIPFSALMSSAGGQGIPGLPFSMQSAALGLGLGSMLASQRVSGVNRGPECLARQNPQDVEGILENGKENERYLSQTGSSSRERNDGKNRESRKRMRSSSLACDSDDDIMVLSNSPSSNEPSEQRENAQSNVWENPPMPMGLGFSIPNPSLVNNSMYAADASSFMAAMGSQMPFDVRKHWCTHSYFPYLPSLNTIFFI